MKKYTLEEMKIKILEEIQQRHKQLIEDCIYNTNSTSLIVCWNDMKTTFENMEIILNDFIGLEDD